VLLRLMSVKAGAAEAHEVLLRLMSVKAGFAYQPRVKPHFLTPYPSVRPAQRPAAPHFF
jgi:hypothetical protein